LDLGCWVLFIDFNSQQQVLFEEEQSQLGSVPLRRPFIIPAAQPTPDLTLIAPSRQFFSQAPHSMQRSFFSIMLSDLLIQTLHADKHSCTSCTHCISADRVQA